MEPSPVCHTRPGDNSHAYGCNRTFLFLFGSSTFFPRSPKAVKKRAVSCARSGPRAPCCCREVTYPRAARGWTGLKICRRSSKNVKRTRKRQLQHNPPQGSSPQPASPRCREAGVTGAGPWHSGGAGHWLEELLAQCGALAAPAALRATTEPSVHAQEREHLGARRPLGQGTGVGRGFSSCLSCSLFPFPGLPALLLPKPHGRDLRMWSLHVSFAQRGQLLQ